jgi:hypothetical protein
MFKNIIKINNKFTDQFLLDYLSTLHLQQLIKMKVHMDLILQLVTFYILG